MLGKILGIASLGEALLGVSMTKRFMTEFVTILGLTLVAAMIAGALVIFGLYESHLAFVRHGMDADLAVIITALIGLFILLVILTLIVNKLKFVQTIPAAVSAVENVGASVIALARGFYKGFADRHVP